jgi:hypothetical protein
VLLLTRDLTAILEDLSVEQILSQSSTWKKERQRSLLTTLDTNKNKIVCTHCFKEVKIEKNRLDGSFLPRHPCRTSQDRKKNGRQVQ